MLRHRLNIKTCSTIKVNGSLCRNRGKSSPSKKLYRGPYSAELCLYNYWGWASSDFCNWTLILFKTMLRMWALRSSFRSFSLLRLASITCHFLYLNKLLYQNVKINSALLMRHEAEFYKLADVQNWQNLEHLGFLQGAELSRKGAELCRKGGGA